MADETDEPMAEPTRFVLLNKDGARVFFLGRRRDPLTSHSPTNAGFKIDITVPVGAPPSMTSLVKSARSRGAILHEAAPVVPCVSTEMTPTRRMFEAFRETKTTRANSDRN